MAGGTLWLDPALMLFTLPEYHHDIHQPLVAGSLWVSLAGGSPPLFWCFLSGLRGVVAQFKSAAPYIWSSYHRAFFWGMVALRAALRRNHYSGAIWLLYVMILVWGLTLGPICLVNCSAN